MITLYGIKNCDTVKRARKALEQADIEFQFHDFKTSGVPEDKILIWINQLGQALVNRRGTTWRKLNAAEQAQCESDPVDVLYNNSSLIKRPVIDKDGELRLGFAAKDADSIVAWLKA